MVLRAPSLVLFPVRVGGERVSERERELEEGEEMEVGIEVKTAFTNLQHCYK